MPDSGFVMPSPGLVMPSLTRHLIFDQQLRNMIPILYRGHIFSFCKDSDEVGFVVESAVIAYLRCTQVCIGKQIACFRNPEIIDICYEGYAGLLLEEVAEGGVRHVDQLGCIRQSDLVRNVFFDMSAHLADSS